MRRTTRITVALLFAAWTVDYIDRLVINLALPSIGDTFDLSHSEQGLIVSAFFLTYAAFQLPGGLLADRFGGLRVACFALVLWSVFTGLTALAWSFGALLAIRFLFGMAQGLFPGAAYNTLNYRTVPETRMNATGWMQSSNAVGGVLASLVGAALLALWDWRAMFAAVCVLGVVMLVAMVRWMPAPLPREESGSQRRTMRGATRAVLRSPAMWGFAVMFFAYDLVLWGLNTWSVSYLVERHGMNASSAGLIIIAPLLAAALSTIIGGKLADRLGGRPRRIVLPAMICSAGLLLLLPQMPSVPTFMICVTTLCAVMALCAMPIFAVPMRSLPTGLTGAAAGMIQLGGQLAGVISPTLFGVVTDQSSYDVAFSMLAAGPVIAIVAVLCVPQTSERFLARFRSVIVDQEKESDVHSVT